MYVLYLLDNCYMFMDLYMYMCVFELKRFTLCVRGAQCSISMLLYSDYNRKCVLIANWCSHLHRRAHAWTRVHALSVLKPDTCLIIALQLIIVAATAIAYCSWVCWKHSGMCSANAVTYIAISVHTIHECVFTHLHTCMDHVLGGMSDMHVVQTITIWPAMHIRVRNQWKTFCY